MSVQRKGASEQRSFQRHSQPLSNWAYVRKGGFFSSAVAAGKKRRCCVTIFFFFFFFQF
jgi:hypothetical protein